MKMAKVILFELGHAVCSSRLVLDRDGDGVADLESNDLFHIERVHVVGVGGSEGTWGDLDGAIQGDGHIDAVGVPVLGVQVQIGVTLDRIIIVDECG